MFVAFDCAQVHAFWTLCVFTARLKNSVSMTLPTRMFVGSSIAAIDSWFFA